MDVYSCTDFSCFETYINRYTIDGDTTIGSYQYSKLNAKTEHTQGADQSQWCTESVDYYENYYGSIRESGKRIFVIRSSFNPIEYIAYDFNLSVGDTVPSPDGYLTADIPSRIINEIDSVLILGVYRKRFLLDNNKYIIEGIGASTGLFNPIFYYSSQCDLRMLCYAEYGTPDHFLINCNMNLGIAPFIQEDAPSTLVKIINYLGQETAPTPNTPLIYIYSDGTTEKVFQVE